MKNFVFYILLYILNKILYILYFTLYILGKMRDDSMIVYYLYILIIVLNNFLNQL